MRTSQRRPDDEAIIRTELETETPGSSSDETLLEARELNMHYGDDRALDSIAERAEIDDRCERARARHSRPDGGRPERCFERPLLAAGAFCSRFAASSGSAIMR